MIAIIRSNKEVSYSISNPLKKAIVEIEVYRWEETKETYTAVTQDYWIEDVTEVVDIIDGLGIPTGETETITYEKRTPIEGRSVRLTIPQLNSLASALEPFLTGLTEHQRRVFLLEQGSLNFVKTDFLTDSNGNVTEFLKYNTSPDDWFLKE